MSLVWRKSILHMTSIPVLTEVCWDKFIVDVELDNLTRYHTSSPNLDLVHNQHTIRFRPEMIIVYLMIK